MQTIEPIARAVEAFASLPGIGPKTAQRLTFHLLRQPPEAVRELAEAITNMQASVHFCSACGNVTDVDPCSICRSDQRDQTTICVVEDPMAVITLERTRIYKGLYHVLHGALDPLHGVTVEDLKIEELVKRVEGGEVREVILATNPNVEGDTTARLPGAPPCPPERARDASGAGPPRGRRPGVRGRSHPGPSPGRTPLRAVVGERRSLLF